MERLSLSERTKAEKAVLELYDDLMRRLNDGTISNCPISTCKAFVEMCLSQSCGKCVPCRIGLRKVSDLLGAILNGQANDEDLEYLNTLVRSIVDTADCAIGKKAGETVLNALNSFNDDFLSHINDNRCKQTNYSIPCLDACPAHVDIPSYIALVKEGRYKDAVRVIRYNNPLPSICALVCEHPCEKACRRQLIDDAINIRGIKRMAVDNAGKVDTPKPLAKTNKKIAVIGGGPAGLTCAYYLQLMGHSVTIFEQHGKLGGMTRYGIPRYRLPEKYLDNDINSIINTGIKVNLNAKVDEKVLKKLEKEYDALYIAIGAHGANKLGIENEDAENVLSAVELLKLLGDDVKPDFTGKRVVIIGGGNVAMDCTRTAKRLGAKEVKCVYRRRQVDMTALPEEIEGAIGEECEIVQMKAPVRIEVDKDNKVKALIVQAQIPGAYDRGRPKPVKANIKEESIPCDIIISAIGQAIDSKEFEKAGLSTNRGRFVTDKNCIAIEDRHIFAGGDCYSGPATVIKAIEAGRVAANNIDLALGYNHVLSHDVNIPSVSAYTKQACGRINLSERSASTRKNDFELIEKQMTLEEAKQECSRCLRCDHYGLAALCKGGNK